MVAVAFAVASVEADTAFEASDTAFAVFDTAVAVFDTAFVVFDTAVAASYAAFVVAGIHHHHMGFCSDHPS